MVIMVIMVIQTIIIMVITIIINMKSTFKGFVFGSPSLGRQSCATGLSKKSRLGEVEQLEGSEKENAPCYHVSYSVSRLPGDTFRA